MGREEERRGQNFAWEIAPCGGPRLTLGRFIVHFFICPPRGGVQLTHAFFINLFFFLVLFFWIDLGWVN
jgi:hypothetical protein